MDETFGKIYRDTRGVGDADGVITGGGTVLAVEGFESESSLIICDGCGGEQIGIGSGIGGGKIDGGVSERFAILENSTGDFEERRAGIDFAVDVPGPGVAEDENRGESGYEFGFEELDGGGALFLSAGVVFGERWWGGSTITFLLVCASESIGGGPGGFRCGGRIPGCIGCFAALVAVFVFFCVFEVLHQFGDGGFACGG